MTWLLAGSWAGEGSRGGITVFRLENGQLLPFGQADRELIVGYLAYDPSTSTLYAADERKTDGRGPVGAPAAIHAFAFDRKSGQLTWKNAQTAPGALPNYLDIDPVQRRLIGTCHGSFDQIERVERDAKGNWVSRILYDSSSVVLYRLAPDGRLDGVADVVVHEGHGVDPNGHPQLGGHGQATARAHCARLDPSGQFAAVCDKGTDLLTIYRMGDTLSRFATFRFPPVTGPRHAAFTSDGLRVFVTEEFASGLACLDFDPSAAQLQLRDRVLSTNGPCHRLNEPAELRVHPNDRFVYLNNRGEDTLTWFSHEGGRLRHEGAVRVGSSDLPRNGARNLMFTPDGQFLLLPDLADHCLRVFRVDPDSGQPTEITSAPIRRPSFVAVVADD